MLPYSAFLKPGRVSVFAGDFHSYEAMDEYVDPGGRFEQDFGFRLDERYLPEVFVEAQPVPIRQLVSGFSAADSFAEAVCAAAERLSREMANTMVVFYFCEFDPARVTINPRAPLVFLGAFQFSGQ